MAGVVKIEITESLEYLQKLLAQNTGDKKERVQALYWLKIGVVETTEHIAVLLACHRTTVSRWLTIYREEGLDKLLEQKKSPGRPRLIPEEALESLKNELAQPEGFNSYVEIKLWLKIFGGLDLSYWTVYEWVHYRALAKLKTPIPRHIKQISGIIERFKKNSQMS